MLARFQAQLEQYPAPWISQKQRLLQDRNQPRLLAQLNPCRSPRRSMSASTTRPIRHSAPSSLSVVTRSHEVDLIHSWRADSLAFVWLDPGITPCCKSRPVGGQPSKMSNNRIRKGGFLNQNSLIRASEPPGLCV